ncbi:hypothetical protein J6590_007713 [Homalodisca vitripennis]|nr:hypothetical protein J6590_007713 [Homalodisca vitripennis]
MTTDGRGLDSYSILDTFHPIPNLHQTYHFTCTDHSLPTLGTELTTSVRCGRLICKATPVKGYRQPAYDATGRASRGEVKGRIVQA